MIDVEPHIDLTTDDLLFLVAKIGSGRPVGLDQTGAAPEPPPGVRQWLDDAAERNLRARGVVDASGDPNPAVADMIRTTGSPGLVISVSEQRAQVIETTVVAAVPDLAVVHAPLAPGVHRLTPLAAVDAIARVRALVHLDPGQVEPARLELSLDLATLESVSTAAQESPAAAVAAARSHGLTSDVAENLASLLHAREATYLVTVMHRSPEVHVGVVSWWSAGELGLWQVRSEANGSSDEIVLTATSAGALLDQVRSHLPGVLSSPV